MISFTRKMLGKIYEKLLLFGQELQLIICPKNIEYHFPNFNTTERKRMNKACQKLLAKSAGTVFSGPFAGMKISKNSYLKKCSEIIVGSYEQEVHKIINYVICRAPKHIINIGSAYGYYTVGLAYRIQKTRIVAFEAQVKPCWHDSDELAKINNVDSKIIQKGTCTSKELVKCCQPDSFILCDVEGAETDILALGENPNLASCLILVELHDFCKEETTPLLIQEFISTHDAVIVDESIRNPVEYRILDAFPEYMQRILIKEDRRIPDKMITWSRFMLLVPKQSLLWKTFLLSI
jgi:hypothetical protein